MRLLSQVAGVPRRFHLAAPLFLVSAADPARLDRKPGGAARQLLWTDPPQRGMCHVCSLSSFLTFARAPAWQLDDVWSLDPGDSAKPNSERLWELWEAEKASASAAGKNPWLGWPIVRFTWKRLMKASCLRFAPRCSSMTPRRLLLTPLSVHSYSFTLRSSTGLFVDPLAIVDSLAGSSTSRCPSLGRCSCSRFCTSSRAHQPSSSRRTPGCSASGWWPPRSFSLCSECITTT